METTMISPDDTVSEIQKILRQYGARSVMTDFKDGEFEAVAFKYPVNNSDVPFYLPCRWHSVLEYLAERRGKAIWSDKIQESYNAKAKRVAWRQILRWVQAQMALVDTRMVKVEEVFFPYIQNNNGQTLFDAIEKSNGGFANLLEYK